MSTGEVVLASGSPRRRELLERLGYRLVVAPSAVDETPLPGEEPVDYARRLARAKALAWSGPEVVVAADTVVHRGGEIFHKPGTPDEAVRTLLALGGGEHLVTTGTCVRRGGSLRVRAVTTRVHFGPIDLALARAYVATGEPLDKAGAYGIQGVGAVLVTAIEGSYTGVVGLPLAEVAADLSALGLPPLAR